ncbi:MAG TPA: DUF6206 family protein [Deltaproteobacteria bacterium]|nr:DUF6206 family protein [Deltaproteobacteria bacterium]
MRVKIDREVVQRFEAGLDPRHPEKSLIPAQIIGYGEMSTIFVIKAPGQSDTAYKRMPVFRTLPEMEHYERIFQEYNTRLAEIGLNIPSFASVRVTSPEGLPVVYNAQSRLSEEAIANRLIHRLPDQPVKTLFLLVLNELHKVFAFNAAHTDIRYGIDGQISNWAVLHYREGVAIGPDTKLAYLDTSTPMIQKCGREQLDPELFLRSAPSFMVWIIRRLFLDGVMTRYYDFRLVVIDLIANFHKEQRPDLIPMLIETANDFFATKAAGLGVGSIDMRAVKAYYRQDAMIWRVYLGMRRFDRFLHRTLLRKPYRYILPGRIKR